MSDWRVGQHVEILPAYNSDTGTQDIYDEIAGCEARIVGVDGHYARAVVTATDDEIEVALTRLRFRPPT